MDPLDTLLSGDESAIARLPSDILFLTVIEYLTTRDILQLCRTSHHFDETLCKSKARNLWKALYQRDISALCSPKENWQASYIQIMEGFQDSSLSQALSLAAFRGHEKLIQRVISLNEKTPGHKLTQQDYNAAILTAARAGHRDIVELLLKEAPESYPAGLAGATMGGHRDIAEAMLRLGAKNHDAGLVNAARGGHADLVELMLEKGATAYNEALAAAAFGDRKAIVNRMLELGANNYSEALTSAAYGGHLDIVKQMLALGATVSGEAINAARSQKFYDIARLLEQAR